tara:strand:- start:448 stop:2193 length:1746 start_codon:yes stop_codon:yes gene_type:complete
MKSPKVKGIGEVVTEYGAKVMKIFKKGLLGRSLFDFYGDVKAQTFRTKESASAPSTPTDGAGGIIYTKSADGKLYYKSNEVSEVEISSTGATLTTEEVQDIVGAMVDGGTETNIAVTYDDAGGKLNFVSTDTNTVYSEATSSSEGLMSTAHHDKLDGIEVGATADQTQADINALAITTVGTISSGVWQGTPIASANLDSDTAHLSGSQTFTGPKTFAAGIIYDGDRNATPGDGAAIHVDASDITDNNTSASGTATAFRHVNIENPRILASNASVTTTTASTVFIKGAPVASTNQTITNAYALEVAAGNVRLGADLLVEGDLQVNGSNANINLNSGSDIILEADNSGGDLSSNIAYRDSGGNNRIILGADSDVAIVSNRASNGTVQIRANTSTAGSGGEVTVVTVHDDKVDISQDLNVTGRITGKQYQVFPTNFIDDFNTSEVFMPIHGTTFEQSQVYQDDVALLAPCDGRIVSVTLSIMSVTGNADLTVRVYTLGPNASGTSLSSWTLEESEVLPITSTDDSHVLHFSFSNAKHFESTEKFAVSIQADSDIMSNSFIYATTVVEWDYNTLLGSSAEYDSVP